MSNERFYLQGAPAPREAVRLLYISKSRYGGDWHSILHTHTCSELFFCLSGAGQFNIAGKLYPVQPDDLVIVNPQVDHTETSLEANPLEYIVLGIEGIEFLFGGADGSFTILNCRAQRERIRFLLRTLMQEVDLNADGCETVCGDLLEVLLIWLVRANNLQLRPYESVKRRTKECATIKRYLDENFRENISLDQLAEMVHINKYYLAHSFQKEYGISPITYMMRQRIAESKYLLANTDYSLSQIASLLGFSSLSYFSQCFRKAEQISPTTYRKQVRSGERSAFMRHEPGRVPPKPQADPKADPSE